MHELIFNRYQLEIACLYESNEQHCEALLLWTVIIHILWFLSFYTVTFFIRLRVRSWY